MTVLDAVDGSPTTGQPNADRNVGGEPWAKQ